LSAALAGQLKSAGIDPEPDPAATLPADDPAYRIDPQEVTGLVADGLQIIHSLDGAASDLDRLSMADTVAAAHRHLDANPEPTLDPAYAHMAPERLLEVLTEVADNLGELPPGDVVVTHGSPGPTTLRCAQGRPVGFSEWHAALADPHRDLAHAATAVASTLGPMLVPVLFDRYGTRPDPRRLDWWSLAGQLTGTAATVRRTTGTEESA